MTEGLALAQIRSTETRLFNGDGCAIPWAWERVNEMRGIPEMPRSYYERGTLGHAMIEAKLNGATLLQVERNILDAYVPPAGDWLETSKCTKEGLIAEVEIVFNRWLAQFDDLEEYEDYDQVNTEVRLDCTTPNGVDISTEADAIFWWGDSPAIVDWKLGTSKSGKAMQLYVYWYAARKSGYIPDGATFRAWFHYATYAKPIVHIIDYPGNEFIEAYIEQAEKMRREGPYLPNPEWFNCSQCQVKDKCPLWGGDWEETREIEMEFV
ncbi:hypothetical protein LCGC14_1983130 [marine sediment metagenome]|uniref:PD-(D/E)XK endonuclease-like domain-containing protein n=1 Tax=marine sediment metagenome TaxID=412755 RepID=A0A0F9F876_9ZZZZ